MNTSPPLVRFEDLGKISYQEGLEYQKHTQSDIIVEKRAGGRPTGSLLLCEHNHVYTLGKSGSKENLLHSNEELILQGIEFHKTNRGGDITYHGPGQVTGYPIFDMDQFYNDVHRYVREIEEVVIIVLQEYNLEGIRIPGFTGVWLDGIKGFVPQRKICAIGVHMSRWVTMHGFALNVNTDISKFDGIIPCGIQEEGMQVTSIAQEMGEEYDIQIVKHQLKKAFKEVFGFKWF